MAPFLKSMSFYLLQDKKKIPSPFPMNLIPWTPHIPHSRLIRLSLRCALTLPNTQLVLLFLPRKLFPSFDLITVLLRVQSQIKNFTSSRTFSLFLFHRLSQDFILQLFWHCVINTFTPLLNCKQSRRNSGHLFSHCFISGPWRYSWHVVEIQQI